MTEIIYGTTIILAHIVGAMMADDLTRGKKPKMKWRRHVNEDLLITATAVFCALALLEVQT